MKAYLFWYRPSADTPTEYCYVIAVTLKQAKYFWFNYLKYTIGYAYDYDLYPCNEIDKTQFTKSHEVGEILGQYARL